jgi:hypothetical protein
VVTQRCTSRPEVPLQAGGYVWCSCNSQAGPRSSLTSNIGLFMSCKLSSAQLYLETCTPDRTGAPQSPRPQLNSTSQHRRWTQLVRVSVSSAMFILLGRCPSAARALQVAGAHELAGDGAEAELGARRAAAASVRTLRGVRSAAACCSGGLQAWGRCSCVQHRRTPRQVRFNSILIVINSQNKS